MNEIKNALDRRLSMTRWTADDTQQVLSAIRKEEVPMKKTVPAACVAALILILLTMAAVFAESQWGVLDWLFRSSARPAAPMATVQPVVLEERGLDTMQVRPLEAVTDGYGFYLSVQCIPQEAHTLLLNAALDPNQNLAREIGVSSAAGDRTIAAWAKEQGITAITRIHLFSDVFSGSASNQGTFDSCVSAAMRLLDDGSSLIMLAGSRLPDDEPYELTCTAIPYIANQTGSSPEITWTLSESAKEQQTGEIRFSVQKIEEERIRLLASYRPEESGQTGPLWIERADLIQSPLASYLLVAYTVREDMDHAQMLPVFAPSMPSDGSQPLSWPDLAMHGRKTQQRADGTMEYQYFCTRKIHFPPDTLEVTGAFGLTPDTWTALSPIWLIRQDK